MPGQSKLLLVVHRGNFMRNYMPRVLLTGATGLVGRYLMKDLLVDGHPLVVFARGRGPLTGEDRIEAILQDWESRLGRRLSRPHVIEADINHRDELETCLGGNERKIIRSVQTVVHSAASLRFEVDEAGEEPLRTNLYGTSNVVNFAQTWQIPNFHYVSTAYVCGKRAGVIQENELDCEQTFHNIYEQSKFQAEQFVREASSFETKTIYRPSIIVGDSENGFSSTFHTIYSIIRFLRALPDEKASNLDWIFERLGLTGDEGKNLVTVDWVSRAMASILSKPSAWNQTYHLTNANPTKVNRISAAISEAIAKEQSHWSAMALPTSITDAQLAYQTHVDVYRGYLANDPVFDRSQLHAQLECEEAPELGPDRLALILGYAIRNRFRDITPALPRKRVLASLRHVLTDCACQLDQQPDSSHSGATVSFSDKLDSQSSDPKLSVWSLQIVGPGGGCWYFPECEVDQPSELAGWVRTTTESWNALLKRSESIDELVSNSKLMIGGNADFLVGARKSLAELIEQCLERSASLTKGVEDTEKPSVVPMHPKLGGRRLA